MSFLELIGIVAVAAAMTGLTLRLARRVLLDHPNPRSSHTVPTPRGGGLGIVAGLAGGAILGGDPLLRAVLVPVLAVAALSFADDIRPLPAKVRLAGHFIVAAAVLCVVGSLKTVAVLPFGATSLPLVVGILTLLWIAGLGNAFNFMDGIDGIAALQGLIAGAAWWWIGSAHGAQHAALGGAIVAAACAGFISFNWQPARIFMGDVGSVTLGVTIAVLPVLAARNGAEEWATPVGVLIIWPFLFDVCFTLAMRLRRGERVLEAHRSHLYQRLVIAGWSHRRTALTYGVLAIVAAAAGGRVAASEWWWGLAAAIFVSATLVLVTRRAERQRTAEAVT